MRALAAYLAGLYEAGRSPAVAGMVAAAVRFQMKLAGKPSPVGPATERVLRGFRRKGVERGRGQVAGVRWEQADAAAAAAANDGRSVKGLRDAAIVAVMSDAMLRVSEAAALHVADLEAEGGNTLTVRRSKTDQEGEGVAQYIGGPTVVRVRAWMDAAGIADGPLFQRLDKAGKPRGRLSTQSIRAIIQRRAQDAGIEGRVSGHSLRVGSAQSLANGGCASGQEPPFPSYRMVARCSRGKRGVRAVLDGPKGNLSVIPAALSRSRGALSPAGP